MTVVARRVAAIPKRTSTETWRAIVALLAPPGTAAYTELIAATNVAAMLIADDCTRDSPIVVTAAAGPRVRIYTVHDEDALDDDEVDESPLASYPTDEVEWLVSLPCPGDEVAATSGALAAQPHVVARSTTDDLAPATAGAPPEGGRAVINLAELERP